MDAVVYPDSGVQELATAFVCIRVDHDRSPELTERFGVRALPDLRFLDSDGQQFGKLVGPTSAVRLLSEAHAVLDRLAGKPAVQPPTSTVVAAVGAPATPEAVKTAVHRGVTFLQTAWREGLPPSAPGFGAGGLLLYAWAASGAGTSGEDFERLRRSVCAEPLAGVYQASIQALALARLAPERHRDRLGDCARYLLDAQLENGQWTYTTAGDDRTTRVGDNSNSAYALFGLAACCRAGIEVPDAAIERAQAWWRSSQNSDGGWGYRIDRETESYASMTESGAGCLALCRELLSHEASTDESLDSAITWIAKHFSVSENSESTYQEGRLLYHLFALERLGDALALPMVAGHDWYQEGAAWLLASQRADGSWDDGADMPVPNTCFAILFLSRATRRPE